MFAAKTIALKTELGLIIGADGYRTANQPTNPFWQGKSIKPKLIESILLKSSLTHHQSLDNPVSASA
jgi:hypothetical protein